MTTTVTVQLTSEDILEKFIGHAGVNLPDFILEVEGAGGVTAYISTHPIYKYLGPGHTTTAIAAYYSTEMREALASLRAIALKHSLLVYPTNPETGEMEPWSAEKVTTF